MSEDLVRMEHIDKFYGRVQALDDVNFNVTRQEIVGLLGDNGAGKSTLIKVLSGAVRATSGDIIVRGKRARHRDDLSGFGARHAALDRAQSVPRSRAAQGSAIPQPHGFSADGAGGRRTPAKGRNRQVDPGLDADLVAVGRRASGGGDRPRDAFL